MKIEKGGFKRSLFKKQILRDISLKMTFSVLYALGVRDNKVITFFIIRDNKGGKMVIFSTLLKLYLKLWSYLSMKPFLYVFGFRSILMSLKRDLVSH